MINKKIKMYWYEKEIVLLAVPPDIDDVRTSSDVIVNEGTDAKLVCQAYGHPTPKIKWLREDKQNFSVYNDDRKQTYQTGSFKPQRKIY